MKEIILILFVATFVAIVSIHYVHIGDINAENWLRQQINLGR